jgi:predicted RNase H-like HicB family nuclease
LQALNSHVGLYHALAVGGRRRRRPVAHLGDTEAELYVVSVPQLPGCHTQGQSLDELMERMREAVELCLEVEGAPAQSLEFIGIQRITVAA